MLLIYDVGYFLFVGWLEEGNVLFFSPSLDVSWRSATLRIWFANDGFDFEVFRE